MTSNFKRLYCFALLTLLAACGGGGGGSTTTTPVATAIKANAVTVAPTTSCSAAGTTASAASLASNTVCMLTSDGEIVVELYADKAPLSVANFLKYVGDGYYSNTLFHRVPKDFVVQGGGQTTGSVSKVPTYAAIKLESNNGLSNLRGTLAMARSSAADSATSEFYFNTVNNTGLDYTASNLGYAVFGKVISGLDTIDKINAEARWSGNVESPATEVLLYWAKKLK